MPPPRLTLNQILALQLRTLMTERGLTDVELGRLAKVAANTVANYKKGPGQYTSTGKERSAKLAEVERIADALGVHPLFLLTDPNEAASRAAEIAKVIVAQTGPTQAQQPGADRAPPKRHRLAA